MYFNNKVSKIINLIFKFEFKRFFFKSILLNSRLPSFFRAKAFLYISKLNKRLSISYLQLRCSFTGCSRFLLTFFKLSRMSFRHLYSRGALVGIRKASR